MIERTLPAAEINYEIELPARMRTQATTRSGNITCHTMQADTHLMTFSGDVGARDIRGNAVLESKSGDVNCEYVQGSLKASTLSGDVDARSVTGDITVESKSGDIKLAECTGSVDANTLSGDVKIRKADSQRVGVHALSGDVDAEIGIHEGGSISLRTTDGDIGLRLPSTAKVRIAATTLSGSVSCGLPLISVEQDNRQLRGVLNEAIGEIDISTASGDVLIEAL